jgi:hypothetical protein
MNSQHNTIATEDMTESNDTMMEYNFTVENIQQHSIEHIMNYLRFKTFVHYPQTQLKSLFIKMANVPIKHEAIVNDIVNAINDNDYEKLYEIVDAHQIIDMEAQLKEQGFELNFKHDYNRMFDFYFSTEDRDLAIALLRRIMFCSCDTQENYDAFLNYLDSLSEEQRKLSIEPMCLYNTFTV